MKTALRLSLLVILLACGLLTGCSDTHSKGTPGNSKVTMKVVFSNSTTASATGLVSLQDAGITRLVLSAVPATASNYAPGEIDLTNVTSGSYTVNNLTDNETYLFKILAYDAGNRLVYAGEMPAAVLPAGSTATIKSLGVTGGSNQYLASAKSQLGSRSVASVKDNLMMSTLTDPGNYEAKVYYALSRIAGLYQAVGSSDSTQMDSIKKIMDAVGISYLDVNTLATGQYVKLSHPDHLLSSTPTTGQVLDYVRNYVLPEIDAAVITLSGVPTSFTATFSPAAYGLQGNNLTIDYADVQVLTTLLKSAKAYISLLCAYDFNANAYALINKNVTSFANYDKGTQGPIFDLVQVLQSNRNIGTAKEAGLLSMAKAAFNAFVANYQTALNAAIARPSAYDHLFTLDSSGGNSAPAQQAKLANLKQIQKAVNGQTTMLPPIAPSSNKIYKSFYGSTASGYAFQTYSATRPSSNNTVNFSQFFDAGKPVNLRTALVDCQSATMFKDRTIAGIYPLGYVTSPIYNTPPPAEMIWVGNTWGSGGWDIDSFYNLPADTRQMIVNGICGAVTAN